MEYLPQFKLVIELFKNVIVFERDNKVVFAGEKIKRSFEDAGICFEALQKGEYSEKSEEHQMKETLENARESQLPRTFVSKKLENVFLFFPVSHTNSDHIIFSVKDKVLQFSKIERELEARIKELECLYSISHTLESSKSLSDAIEKCTQHIKEGFQHPKNTKVVIEQDSRLFGDVSALKYKRYNELNVDIKLNNKKRGNIHVHLIKKMKFLEAEETLIQEISGKIARAIENNEKKNAYNNYGNYH